MYTGPILRGHVFWVGLEGAATLGSEQRGRRLWIVVSAPKLHRRVHLVLAVPTTSKTEKLAGFQEHRLIIPEDQFIPVQGQAPPRGDSLVLTEQLRALSLDRLEEDPVARVTTAYMLQIDACLAYVLDLPG